MTESHVQALFLLARWPITKTWAIENKYWPKNEHFAEMREANPWWLVKTDIGIIEIGWRKRVIQIDWSDTGHKLDVTCVCGKDDVTREPHLVHAWGYAKAVAYLENLRLGLQRARAAPVDQDKPDSSR